MLRFVLVFNADEFANANLANTVALLFVPSSVANSVASEKSTMVVGDAPASRRH